MVSFFSSQDKVAYLTLGGRLRLSYRTEFIPSLSYVIQPNEGAFVLCVRMATHVQSFSLTGQFML